MDLNFTPEEQHFREQVATWLRENVPHEPRPYEGVEARSERARAVQDRNNHTHANARLGHRIKPS